MKHYTIEFTKAAQETIKTWKKSAPMLLKKLLPLLDELMIHPREGKGKPKQLQGDKTDVFSRRITGQHRLLYKIQEEKVLVLVVAIGGHYDDK